MGQHISPAMARTFRSPIPEAYSWLDGMSFPADRPLINLSQAAPTDPPPIEMRQAMADALLNNADSHLYGPVLGMDALREAVAQRWSREHGANVKENQVAITSGCNQAFASVISTLASTGDQIILPTPWYFNHKMWLEMSGIDAVPLRVGADMLPDTHSAQKLITPKTRAIALVSPNNPTGIEYPPALIRAFYDLARSNGIYLILDETYRDFMASEDAPHDVFCDADWDETLIQLYSFSKAYRLTGHRVGSITAAPERLAEVEKFIDSVTICPSQVGQIGALWGMNNLSEWLAGERAEILARRAAIKDGFAALTQQGWTLQGLGGFFAYMAFPHEIHPNEFSRRLLQDASLLTLPGSMFVPSEFSGNERALRIAFANIDADGITTLYNRLSNISI